ALVGAISVNWLRSVLTATYPTLWPIILGGLFVTVIMLFPEGLVGLAARAKTLLARRRRAVAPAAIPASGVNRHTVGAMDTLLYVEHLTVSLDALLALRTLNLIVERDEPRRLLIPPHG